MNKKDSVHLSGVFFILHFDDLLKCSWMLSGELRQDFAVKQDVALLESSDDFGVAHAHGFDGGSDASLLQSTVVAFLETAVAIGVGTGFGGSNLSEGDFALATPHHALGTGEDVLAALDAMGSTFDARHRIRSW